MAFRNIFLLGGVAAAVAATASLGGRTAGHSRGELGDITMPDLDVVSQFLDRARSQIQPNLGATRYEFSRQAVETIPQGDNAPLNQVLLQAPGVAQDSFGQIHVRGDHNEVQYRLDGVQLPEGLSVFGQALETRFAHSMSLITGALPAQYGFLQAACRRHHHQDRAPPTPAARSRSTAARATISSRAFPMADAAVQWDYFVTGDCCTTRVGIENPDRELQCRSTT